MTLSVDTEIDPTADLYGKTVSDLQSDVVIADDAITGTLAYISDYTDFSDDTDLQKGNYLALHVTIPDGATVTVSLGSDSGEVDADGIVVLRIADKDAQLVITSTVDGETETLTFDLSGLTLESSGG